MSQWIANHFLYSMGIAILLIIGGAGIALGTENKWGWGVLGLGVVLLIWAAKLQGLLG